MDGGKAQTHLDYSTRGFDEALTKMRAIAGTRDKSMIDSRVEALALAMQYSAQHNFATQALTAVQHLRHVLGTLLAYSVVMDGEQTWREAFAGDPDGTVNGYMHALYPDAGSRGLQRTLIWHMAQWVVEGRRLFAPTEALCKRLERVDLRGLTGADIAPPFRSYYVMIPYGVGLPIPDDRGAVFPLRGLYVMEDPYDNETRQQGKWLHLALIGQWIMLPNTGHYDDQILYCTLNLEGEGGAEQCYQSLRRAWMRGTGQETDDVCHYLVPVGRWVWNLLAYLSDANVRRETRWLDPMVGKLHAKMSKHSGRKRQRAKDELRGRSQQRIIVVGHDIATSPPGAGTGKPLEVRQKVRGHKKRQPFGPRGQDRKEISIAPYWRGPEDGEEGGSQFMLR